ncbi:MAG TPA: DNA mismatch repair protein MutS, partial [Flavobacteriaceae bacterium]|nr:DNA mismatch repair protein MutS [Flavobacteriaceae bacterium]
LKALAKDSKNESLQIIGEQLQDCETLRNKIKETLKEEAPVNVLKGNAIAPGVNEELDELRSIAKGGKDYLDKMLEREQERTGITSLKIASNNVFGYYIEVRNTHKDKVPQEWIRKQTLVSAERYIT